MGSQRSVYEIYGLRLADDTDRAALEEKTGQCLNNGQPGVFWAGVYDADMTFLALTWRELEVGAYTFHPGDRPSEHPDVTRGWNERLRVAAMRLGLHITGGPGWFTVFDES